MKFKVLGSVFLILVAGVFAFGKPLDSKAATPKTPVFTVNYTLLKTGGKVRAWACADFVDYNGDGVYQYREPCNSGRFLKDVSANGPLRYDYIAIVNVTAKYLPVGWHKCLDDVRAYQLPLQNYTGGTPDRNNQTGIPGSLSDSMIFKNELKEYVGASSGTRSMDWYGNNFYYSGAESATTKFTFLPKLLICGPSKTAPSVLTWNVIQSAVAVTLPVLNSPQWEYIDEFAYD